MHRLISICRLFVRPKTPSPLGHWPADYIPHYRDMAILPDGRPRIRFLRDVFNIRVSGKVRDSAWEQAKILGHGRPQDSDFDLIFGYYFDDRAA